jgi:hypothetical protein
MKNIILIKTTPLPIEEIAMPEFEAPSNYKDQVKIDAHIVEQRKKYLEDAAFNPMTGKIVAIGIQPIDGTPTIIASIAPTMEEMMIRTLLEVMSEAPFTGWYLRQFIIPFVSRRAWKLGVDMPGLVGVGSVDIADQWSAGEKGIYPKLDDVAKFLLGVNVPIMKDVHTLLVDGNGQDVTTEIERELDILAKLAVRMGMA